MIQLLTGLTVKLFGRVVCLFEKPTVILGITSDGKPAALLVAENGALRFSGSGVGVPTARDGACNGASQTVAAANANRIYFSFQNPSASPSSAWVNIRGGAAVMDHTCIEVAPGQAFSMNANGFVSMAAITVIGPSGAFWHADEA